MTRNARAIATTTILGYVASSTAGKFYEIRRGDDGVMYCTCPAWPFAKQNGGTCKHMKGIMGGTITLRPAAIAPLSTQAQPPAPAPAPRVSRPAAQTRRSSPRRGAPLQPGPQPAAVTMDEVQRMNRALLSGTMSLTQSGMVTGAAPEVDDVL